MAKTGPKTKYHEKRKNITFRSTENDRGNLAYLFDHFNTELDKNKKELSKNEVLSLCFEHLAFLLKKNEKKNSEGTNKN